MSQQFLQLARPGQGNGIAFHREKFPVAKLGLREMFRDKETEAMAAISAGGRPIKSWQLRSVFSMTTCLNFLVSSGMTANLAAGPK